MLRPENAEVACRSSGNEWITSKGSDGSTCLTLFLSWGGRGGGQFDPPCTKFGLPRDRRRSRHAFFMSFFFQVLRIFWYQVCENRTIGHRSRDVLYSTVGTKFAQNLYFAYVCVKNTWKLLIFLKCTKTVFILSLGPFAQFLLSWN